jgi:hypothetical protein
MALTNLATVDDDVQAKIVKDGGWTTLNATMACDNPRVQCACVELAANLITCEKVVERLRSASGEQDLKILLMFCGTEDLPTQRAATGAIAMVTADPEVAYRVGTIVLTSYLQPDSEEEEGEADGDKTQREITRTGCEVLGELVSDMELDPDVRVRVDVCIENVGAALKARRAS